MISDKKADEKVEDEEFDLDAMSDDDDNVFAKPAKKDEEEEKGSADMIVKVRKYDLSITYDFYT